MPPGVYKRRFPIWNKGLTKETDERVRNNPGNFKKGMIPWNKGQPRSGKTKEKISNTRQGIAPWNKGLTKEIDDRVRKNGFSLSESLKKSGARQGSKNSMAGVHRYGSASPNWRGGRSSLEKLIRSVVTFKLWRNAIFARDKFQCQDCGKIGGKLNAHHLKPFSQILKEEKIISLGQALKTEELWDLNNGITLCKECHKKRHWGVNE